MKRIEKIFQYIIDNFNPSDREELLKEQGLSAGKIAEDLDILRNNVSMELNSLVRQGKVVKVKKRPVLYCPKIVIEKIFDMEIQNLYEIDTLEKYIDTDESSTKDTEVVKVEEKNPFKFIIGYDFSLKNQIDQARAAVLYPPHGLHTLILGPTGSGKTLFANQMYAYGKYCNKFSDNSPFIVFNCADYYNNSQLLLSQIFGHVKGAFTGADKETEGLVEMSNGGMLFLDEIHRLPPEGQEMIFYFMDTGKYNKLGENGKERASNVFIVSATTEDPNSSLLKTFLRRIPIIITLPSLNERPIKERVDIVKHLIAQEANRIDRKIKVTSDVFRALIGSASFGNIGQLKSNIQLVCAKGFLESMKSKGEIYIDINVIPQNIKDGLILLANKRKENEEMSMYIDSVNIIDKSGVSNAIRDDIYEPNYNLYKIIEDKANILKAEGVDQEFINKFITTDINLHIKSHYGRIKKDNKINLSKIVEEEVYNLVVKIKKIAEEMLDKRLQDKFLYFMGFHISGFLKRKDKVNEDTGYSVEDIKNKNKREFKVALKIKSMIEEEFDVEVPNIEIVYLTIMLASINEDSVSGKVGIVVAAHGSSTATSMVNVAVKLLGDCNIRAIDMPLEINPSSIIDNITYAVEEVNRGEGVLLLVDMGSLYSLEEKIMDRTKVKIKTIDMVSTATVLEAVRKANFLDMDLNSIYISLKNINSRIDEVTSEEEKVILSICSTGEGTAVKLKTMIEDILVNITNQKIKVVPLSTNKLKANINKISSKYNIIAAIGIKRPPLDVPFISLEALIQGEGEQLIYDIIEEKGIAKKVKPENILLKDLCEDSLNKFLIYLNPTKAVDALLRFCKEVENMSKVKFNNTTILRIVFHTAFALERKVKREPLEYNFNKDDINLILFNHVKESAKLFKSVLNIDLDDDELYYIVDLLEDL